MSTKNCSLQLDLLTIVCESRNFAVDDAYDSMHVITNARSVAVRIIEYASSTNMDLIVIGTKGKTGGHKFLVGGIANKIIDHAHCPVLAVR